MRFFVKAEQAGAGWAVTVHPERADAPPLVLARAVRRIDDGPRALPLPPLDEPGAAAFADPAAVAPGLRQMRGRLLVDRRPGGGDMEDFGRYLFTTLLGGSAWKAIVARAQGAVDLSLQWKGDDATLNRLPWEMMYGPVPGAPGQEAFLTAMAGPEVSILRVVEGSPAATPTICTPLRVLFVIGARLDDPRIQAGAEYLGLLRRLEAVGQSMNSRVIVGSARAGALPAGASLEEVEDAITRFRPSIIHFIGHGGVDGQGMGFLELSKPDKPEERAQHTAGNLVVKLRPGGAPLPAIVVLTVCHSADGASSAQASLGAGLVAAGVPIVVGMGGKVADRACRLFTRRFYESILERRPVDRATADARRAGLTGGQDPRTSVEWAVPVLFVGEGVSTAVPVEPDQAAQHVSHLAAGLRKVADPKFCDRIDAIEAYHDFLVRYRDGAVPPVLAIECSAKSVEGIQVEGESRDRVQLGMTSLLGQIAARSPYDGFLTCFFPQNKVPASVEDAADDLLTLAGDMRKIARVARLDGLETRKLLRKAPPEELAPEIRSAWEDHGQRRPTRALAIALRFDLLRLASEGLGLRPMLVIDRAHQWGQATELLVELLEEGALADAASRFPVVFGCDLRLEGGEFAKGCATLRAFFEGHSDVQPIPLGAFPRQVVFMAYRQYLLQRRPPLVLDPGAASKQTDGLLNSMHRRVGGVPPFLWRDQAEEVVLVGLDMEVLVDADDQHQLAALAGGGR